MAYSLIACIIGGGVEFPLDTTPSLFLHEFLSATDVDTIAGRPIGFYAANSVVIGNADGIGPYFEEQDGKDVAMILGYGEQVVPSRTEQ